MKGGDTRTGPEIGERAGGGAGQPAAAGERGGGVPAQEARAEKGLGLEEAEPWPEAVKGEGLLDELEAVLGRFVVLPAAAGEALALWVLHTYAFELREVSTYVGVESPEKRCGKTTLLTVLSELVRRPVVAANISSSALFRVIEEAQPTLLIDEADTLLYGNDELRGILNSGYTRKTAYVVRVASQGNLGREGGAQSSGLARFSCWCPKVLAAVGRLPETLADRCIVVRMQRKRGGEELERLRNLEGGEWRRKCARFVADNADAIARARPEIPAGLNDRAGDIWEPLLALADLAGGKWPEKARRAAMTLSASAEENSPSGALFMDIFAVFTLLKVERLFSRTLAAGLHEFRDRPWSEGLSGKGYTELWLAEQLRPYGIRPTTIRIGEAVGRGYLKDDFAEVFLRYIPEPEVEALRTRS